MQKYRTTHHQKTTLKNNTDNSNNNESNNADNGRNNEDWFGESFVIEPPLMEWVTLDGTDFDDCRRNTRSASFVLLVSFFL